MNCVVLYVFTFSCNEALPFSGRNGDDPYADIVVDISSTKVNAVLKELARIRRDFPGDKTIVVSQFTSLLSIFQVIMA